MKDGADCFRLEGEREMMRREDALCLHVRLNRKESFGNPHPQLADSWCEAENRPHCHLVLHCVWSFPFFCHLRQPCSAVAKLEGNQTPTGDNQTHPIARGSPNTLTHTDASCYSHHENAGIASHPSKNAGPFALSSLFPPHLSKFLLTDIA